LATLIIQYLIAVIKTYILASPLAKSSYSAEPAFGQTSGYKILK